MSADTPNSPQTSRVAQRTSFFLTLTVALCMWAVVAALLAPTLLPQSAVVVPYQPILRFTTTVDDTPPPPSATLSPTQVQVSAFVAPVRTIILDDHDAITAVWSNTAGNYYFYTLVVRRGSLTGPQLTYTPTVHNEYVHLIPVVDWSGAGLVYATHGVAQSQADKLAAAAAIE